MSFIIDTDICSAQMSGHALVQQKFQQHMGQLSISTIILAELVVWTRRRNAPVRRTISLQRMLADFTVRDVTVSVAEKFGEIRARLLDAGQAAPQMDLLIAATAFVYNLTVVTHNTQDYARIQGLRIQDWMSP